MPGWRSGQSHLTVNQAPSWLRRFESFTRHQSFLVKSEDSKAAVAAIGSFHIIEHIKGEQDEEKI